MKEMRCTVGGKRDGGLGGGWSAGGGLGDGGGGEGDGGGGKGDGGGGEGDGGGRLGDGGGAQFPDALQGPVEETGGGNGRLSEGGGGGGGGSSKADTELASVRARMIRDMITARECESSESSQRPAAKTSMAQLTLGLR